MKVASSNQSLILATGHQAPRPKAGSVFDAALGPAASRSSPRRLTIVASPQDGLLIDENPADGAAAKPQQSNDAPQQGAQPLALISQATPLPARRTAAAGTAQYRHPIQLYAQTQQILDRRSPRSVYLDVHA